MDPQVISQTPGRKEGVACSVIVIAVPPGTEEVWSEAAMLSGQCLSARQHSDGHIVINVERRGGSNAVNVGAVLASIKRQHDIATAREVVPQKRTKRAARPA